VLIFYLYSNNWLSDISAFQKRKINVMLFQYTRTIVVLKNWILLTAFVPLLASLGTQRRQVENKSNAASAWHECSIIQLDLSRVRFEMLVPFLLSPGLPCSPICSGQPFNQIQFPPLVPSQIRENLQWSLEFIAASDPKSKGNITTQPTPIKSKQIPKHPPSFHRSWYGSSQDCSSPYTGSGIELSEHGSADRASWHPHPQQALHGFPFKEYEKQKHDAISLQCSSPPSTTTWTSGSGASLKGARGTMRF